MSSQRFPVVATRRAQQQVATARAWWRAHRDKAPHAFDEALDDALDRLSLSPAIGERVRTSRRSGMRRWHIERIRYAMYYVIEGDLLIVLSFWHTSRRPPKL